MSVTDLTQPLKRSHFIIFTHYNVGPACVYEYILFIFILLCIYKSCHSLGLSLVTPQVWSCQTNHMNTKTQVWIQPVTAPALLDNINESVYCMSFLLFTTSMFLSLRYINSCYSESCFECYMCRAVVWVQR